MTQAAWAWEEGVRHVAAADPVLGRFIAARGPLAFDARPARSIFQGLAEAIVYQQLNGRAAATILARVVALYRPKRFPSPADVLATPDATLRAAGLSAAKTAAMKDLAAHVLAGEIPTLAAARTLDDETLVAELTRVRGIGRWTVEMLLMFRLRRPDVLPVGDYGVCKGFQLLYGLRKPPRPERLVKHAECWRPFRSVGSWYMWRATEA